MVGDVSFLHDLTALAMARQQDLALAIVLVDNDGGGIFSFLPQASSVAPGTGLPEHYEQLFGTPHGTDLPAAIRALGAGYREGTHRGLAAAIGEAVSAQGVNVVHLRTDRARNLVLHREVAAAVQAAISR